MSIIQNTNNTHKTDLQHAFDKLCKDYSLSYNCDYNESHIIDIILQSQDNVMPISMAHMLEFIKNYCSLKVKKQLIPHILSAICKTRLTTKLLLSIELIIDMGDIVDEDIMSIDDDFSRDEEDYDLLFKDATLFAYLVQTLGSYKSLKHVLNDKHIKWSIVRSAAKEFGLWFNQEEFEIQDNTEHIYEQDDQEEDDQEEQEEQEEY